MRHTLIASAAGPMYRSCLDAMFHWPCFLTNLPNSVWIGMDKVANIDSSNWMSLLLNSPRESAALWTDEEWNAFQGLWINPGSELASGKCPNAFADLKQALSLLEPVPFELCAIGSIYHDEWSAADYRDWGFARSHAPHGLGCAFRGAGHDRLVSRRWLDFGPWRVIRRPNDTTFIQFHDLAITDPAEAYEQAKAGHQRMGIDPIGGFIQGIDLDVISEVRGLYMAESLTLEIVVGPGNHVSQQDMRVACGLRLHHRLTKPANDRIDHVAYVFMDRGDAQAHLHELWLRELQCWYVDERGKHRLDVDYHPKPQPPAWVANLKAHSVNDI